MVGVIGSVSAAPARRGERSPGGERWVVRMPGVVWRVGDPGRAPLLPLRLLYRAVRLGLRLLGRERMRGPVFWAADVHARNEAGEAALFYIMEVAKCITPETRDYSCLIYERVRAVAALRFLEWVGWGVPEEEGKKDQGGAS